MQAIARRRWWGRANALPVTVVGACASLVGGMRWRVVNGVCEAHGGWLGRWMARRTRVEAITLGHVVLALDGRVHARWRSHERVHVAQYERWGALMPLLYAASSLQAMGRGRQAYRDNAFEREARVLSRMVERQASRARFIGQQTPDSRLHSRP